MQNLVARFRSLAGSGAPCGLAWHAIQALLPGHRKPPSARVARPQGRTGLDPSRVLSAHGRRKDVLRVERRRHPYCMLGSPALPFHMPRSTLPQRSVCCLIFDPRTGRNLGKVGRNWAEISDSKTPESEHWREFAARSVVGLLIRRSLVRAQVGEPKTPSRSRG